MKHIVKNCLSVKGFLGQIQLSNPHYGIVLSNCISSEKVPGQWNSFWSASWWRWFIIVPELFTICSRKTAPKSRIHGQSGSRHYLCFHLFWMHSVPACNKLAVDLEVVLSWHKLVMHSIRYPVNYCMFYFNVLCILSCTMNQKMHTIISQIITLLHVSTLSCHPQTVCNQYLAQLHQYFKCSWR